MLNLTFDERERYAMIKAIMSHVIELECQDKPDKETIAILANILDKLEPEY